MLKQAFADIAQAQLLAPLDQRCLQLGFKPGHRLAHRRLADMQGLGRPLEAPFFHHRAERAQLTVFKAHIS
jgi:hypothetical protein